MSKYTTLTIKKETYENIKALAKAHNKPLVKVLELYIPSLESVKRKKKGFVTEVNELLAKTPAPKKKIKSPGLLILMLMNTISG